MPDKKRKSHHAQAARIALVTGGSSGIGRNCCEAFATEGYDVVVCYYGSREEAMEVVHYAEHKGVRAIALRVDVRHEAQVEKMYDRVVSTLGIPCVLVNSAGLNMAGIPVAKMELHHWQNLLDTDLTGSFLTSRRFVRELTGTKVPGRIINISSIHATAMRAGGAGYDAAKAGLRALTATMALETAAACITVNAIAPGMILTPMNKKAMTDPEYLKGLVKHIPAGRAGKAEEVARLAVFLASAEASYITGTTITIDGGLSLLMAQGA
jgi:glucose 1-dehydrogenase